MFSTYAYPEKSSVPNPPIPSGTLGTVNPSFSNVSTTSIGGSLQGEYINSEMDAKQGVAQYTPIIQNIPCQVRETEKRTIFPKGTLVLFTDTTKTKSGINSSMGYPRSRLSDPEPVAMATFNTQTSQNGKSGKQTPVVPRIIFPLSESTEIIGGKPQYIAVSVQDTGEILVPTGNPSISFKPGDPIFASTGANGIYHISEGRGEFFLGTSLVYQCYDTNCMLYNQSRSFQVALCPRKM